MLHFYMLEEKILTRTGEKKKLKLYKQEQLILFVPSTQRGNFVEHYKTVMKKEHVCC